MSDVATVLAYLEPSGRALVERLGVLNMWTAALLVGALSVDRAVARRARASWRIALYAPVALRVLLPAGWTLHVASAPRVEAFLAPLARIGGSAGADVTVGTAPSWYSLVAIVYVAVGIALAARAILARVRLGRALAGAPPVLGRALAGERPVLGPHPGVPCPVVQHDELGPMVVGLLSPRVVLPRRLLVAGEEHALACVLRHEVAHLRRRDAWLSAALQLLSITAWPVVPVWIAVARVRQLVELACDEAAVDGADATERRRYGHTLLDIAEWRALMTPLGAGELHFGSTLRARIEALGARRHWPLGLQAMVLTAAALALFAACATTPPSASAPATSSADEGYGYEFEVDSAKAAASSPANAPMPPPGPGGRLPPEAVQSAVRARFPAIQSCYDAGLARNPKLAGTVSVRFVFGEDGVTREAEDARSTLPDKAVVGCITAEFRKITYPKTHAGLVTVVYPIALAP